MYNTLVIDFIDDETTCNVAELEIFESGETGIVDGCFHRIKILYQLELELL